MLGAVCCTSDPIVLINEPASADQLIWAPLAPVPCTVAFKPTCCSASIDWVSAVIFTCNCGLGTVLLPPIHPAKVTANAHDRICDHMTFHFLLHLCHLGRISLVNQK